MLKLPLAYGNLNGTCFIREHFEIAIWTIKVLLTHIYSSLIEPLPSMIKSHMQPK